MLDIAGVTVGAAFVGTIASTFVIGDILRLLHGGQNYAVITLDLRSPAGIQAPPADCDASPRYRRTPGHGSHSGRALSRQPRRCDRLSRVQHEPRRRSGERFYDFVPPDRDHRFGD